MIPSRTMPSAPAGDRWFGPAPRNASHCWCPKEHHTRRLVDGPSAKTGPGRPRPNCAATKVAVRRGRRRTPERSGGECAASERQRSATHRPTRSRGPTRAGRARLQRYAGAERGGCRASSELGSSRDEHEGDLEGEQGPGRVGQRTPEYGVRWYGPDQCCRACSAVAEQSLEGPRPFDTTERRSWKRRRSEAADRRRRKVRGGKGRGDAHQRCGNTSSCDRGESSGGYELRCGEPQSA
jgi:hypothetical protein